MQKAMSPIAVLFFALSALFFVAPLIACSKSGVEQTTQIAIDPLKEVSEHSAVITWRTARPVPVTLELRLTHGPNKESRFIDGGNGTRGIVTLPDLEAGKWYEVRAISLEQMGGGRPQPTTGYWSFFTSEEGKNNGWSGMEASTLRAFAGAGY